MGGIEEGQVWCPVGSVGVVVITKVVNRDTIEKSDRFEDVCTVNQTQTTGGPPQGFIQTKDSLPGTVL